MPENPSLEILGHWARAAQWAWGPWFEIAELMARGADEWTKAQRQVLARWLEEIGAEHARHAWTVQRNLQGYCWRAAPVALLSGGLDDTGESISEGLAQAGYRVAALHAPDQSGAARAWQHRCRSRAHGVELIECEVMQLEQCRRMVERLQTRLGHILVLVNVVTPMPAVANAVPLWRTALDAHLDALFNLSRSVVPAMLRRHRGHIINVFPDASAATAQGSNAAMLRAGVSGFSNALARELAAEGVAVTMLSLGVEDPIAETIAGLVSAGDSTLDTGRSRVAAHR